MKKFLCLAFLFVFAGINAAQSPVSWTLETDKGDKAASFKAKLKAKIDAPWHLYAIDQAAGGPIPTSIVVPEGSQFKIAGPITSSPKPKTQFDQNFQIPTKYFEETAEFTVPMSAAAGVDVQELALQVRFQVCNDTTCLPPKTVRITLAGFDDVK